MKKGKVPTFESSEALESRLDEMGRKLDRLRALYEAFFMGTERTPPNVPRRELNRLVLEMQQVQIHNASMRFRFQSLLQRWVLLTTYWNRTLREIEMGTYRRDVARVHRHLAETGGVISEADAIVLGIPARRAKAFVEQQQRLALRRRDTPASGPPASLSESVPEPVPPPTAHAKAPVAFPRPPVPGVTEEKLQSFFQRYVDAHVQAAGAPPKVTFAQMEDRLRKELPRVLEAKKCTTVDLDVAIEDGKIRLKVRPVRG